MSAHLSPTASPLARLQRFERPARRPAALAAQAPLPAGTPAPRPARILPQDLNEPRAGLLLALDLGPAYALRSGRFRTSRSPHSYHPLSVAWALGSGLAATVPTRISQTVVLTAEGRRYVAENRRRLAEAADWNPRSIAGEGGR